MFISNWTCRWQVLVWVVFLLSRIGVYEYECVSQRSARLLQWFCSDMFKARVGRDSKYGLSCAQDVEH